MSVIYKEGKYYNIGNFSVINTSNSSSSSSGESSSKDYDDEILALKKRILILESTDFTTEDID